MFLNTELDDLDFLLRSNCTTEGAKKRRYFFFLEEEDFLELDLEELEAVSAGGPFVRMPAIWSTIS